MKVSMSTCACGTHDRLGHPGPGQLIPSGLADRTGGLTGPLSGCPDTGVDRTQKAE